MKFSRNILELDPAAETARIVAGMRAAARRFRKMGAVVGISGGIDSSVVLALAVKAFGAARVTAIMLPEKDSDPLSERLARQLAAAFGVTPIREEITGALEGFDCYARRDEAIRRVFPEFDADAGYTVKIGLPQDLLDQNTLNVFSVTIVTPAGEEKTKPLQPRDFLQIVAASNFKQRSRMSLLYFHAELNNFLVLGTANKNEHDQGFFVKYGDSGIDFKTIAHLYKTQVYQLAGHLGVPEEIQQRPPTTDTYSARSTQEEFFFRLPFATMDLLWYAQENGYDAAEVATVMGLTEQQVERAFADFDQKRRTTEYLRAAPLEVEEALNTPVPNAARTAPAPLVAA